MFATDKVEELSRIRDLAIEVNGWVNSFYAPDQDRLNRVISLLQDIIQANYGYDDDDVMMEYSPDWTDAYCNRRRAYEQLRDAVLCLESFDGSIRQVIQASCELSAAYMNFGGSINVNVDSSDVG